MFVNKVRKKRSFSGSSFCYTMLWFLRCNHKFYTCYLPITVFIKRSFVKKSFVFLLLCVTLKVIDDNGGCSGHI